MDVLYVYLYVVYMSYEIIVHLITSSNMDSSERNVRKFIKYALKLICNYSDSSYTILTVSGIVSTCCSPQKLIRKEVSTLTKTQRRWFATDVVQQFLLTDCELWFQRALWQCSVRFWDKANQLFDCDNIRTMLLMGCFLMRQIHFSQYSTQYRHFVFQCMVVSRI